MTDAADEQAGKEETTTTGKEDKGHPSEGPVTPSTGGESVPGPMEP